MAASLPNALPALMTLAGGVLPENFQVIHDVNMLKYIAPQTLLVGGAKFNQDAPVVMGPPYKHEEHYGIQCSLFSSAGDNSELERLNEVYALYKSIAKAINESATLPDASGVGTVRVAWSRQLGYNPRRDTKGRPYGQLDFEVQCQARVDPTN